MESDVGLSLMALRSLAEMKPRVGPSTNKATQVPQLWILSTEIRHYRYIQSPKYICHQPHSFIFLPGVNHDLESSEFFKLVTIQYDFHNFLTSFYIVLETESYDSYYNYLSTY